MMKASLTEGEDFYWEGEVIVFTSSFHLRRGYCCESGCRHCPYRQTTTPATAKHDGARESMFEAHHDK